MLFNNNERASVFVSASYSSFTATHGMHTVVHDTRFCVPCLICSFLLSGGGAYCKIVEPQHANFVYAVCCRTLRLANVLTIV